MQDGAIRPALIVCNLYRIIKCLIFKRNSIMKNFISKISKDALVSSSVALMMQEQYYYSLCPYWYDKFGQKYDTSISRDTPMYMCECYTLEECYHWLITEHNFSFEITQNEGIYHIVVVNCNCVVYKSKRESKCFKTIEEALNKGMEEALEFLY